VTFLDVENYAKNTNANGPTRGGWYWPFTNCPTIFPFNDIPSRFTVGISSLPTTSGMAGSASFVSPPSRANCRSSGGVSLHSLSTSRLLLYTHRITFSPLPKKRNGGFPPPVASAQRLTVNRFVCIHFLNLLDGSPRSAPPSNITWKLPREVAVASIENLAITGSRIMMRIHPLDVIGRGGVGLRRILVWDWKIGDLVRFLLLECLRFAQSASGARPSTHGWEHADYSGHQGHLSRRIPGYGFDFGTLIGCF